MTRLGFRVTVGLEPLLGDIEVVRLTCPAKPPMLVRVRVALVAEPRVTFIEEGEDVIEKSGERGGTTLRILVTLWMSLPLAPTTIIAYVLRGADAGTDTESVVDPDPVSRETEPGFSAIVTFVIPGVRVQFRLTLPAKLFRLVSDTVIEARLPCGAVIETGFVARVKSGFVGPPVPATSLNMVEA